METKYPILYNKLGNSNKLPDMKNRFIQGINSSTELGDLVSEGLPNIEGYFGGWTRAGNVLPVASGAFKRSDNTISSSWASGSADAWYRIDFNASKYNSIYGNSTTVQPLSIKLNIIIKAL